jgi:hypothetical protein
MLKDGREQQQAATKPASLVDIASVWAHLTDKAAPADLHTL